MICIQYFVNFLESAQYLKASESDIRDMQYSALLGGFAIVLENGRGGFLSASTSKFEPQVTSAFHATLKLAADNDVDTKVL